MDFMCCTSFKDNGYFISKFAAFQQYVREDMRNLTKKVISISDP